MDLLELPLEAVAFRLHSLPGAASTAGLVWAWAAVLAAALGLWGIRAAGSPKPCSSPPPTPPPVPAVPADPQESPADQNDRGPIAAPPSGRPTEEAAVAKVRFTAFYLGASCDACGVVDVDEDECDEEAEDDGGVRGVGCRVAAPWSGGWRWEGLTAQRRRDLGWYRYVDMTALNGSVVKLWDAGDGGLTATRRPRQKLLF